MPDKKINVGIGSLWDDDFPDTPESAAVDRSTEPPISDAIQTISKKAASSIRYMPEKNPPTRENTQVPGFFREQTVQRAIPSDLRKPGFSRDVATKVGNVRPAIKPIIQREILPTQTQLQSQSQSEPPIEIVEFDEFDAFFEVPKQKINPDLPPSAKSLPIIPINEADFLPDLTELIEAVPAKTPPRVRKESLQDIITQSIAEVLSAEDPEIPKRPEPNQKK